MSVYLLMRLGEGSRLLRGLLEPQEVLNLLGDSRHRMQAGQGRQPDSILSSPKHGCRLRPCSVPSSTPPASTGRSSAPSAGSAPTTTMTSSATGSPLRPAPSIPPGRDGQRDGPQLSLMLAGGATCRHGISLLFSQQIPGATGGLQGGGHHPSRPHQLEGEEEQGVQRAGEGSGAGVAHPRTDSARPITHCQYFLSFLGLFFLLRE